MSPKELRTICGVYNPITLCVLVLFTITIRVHTFFMSTHVCYGFVSIATGAQKTQQYYYYFSYNCSIYIFGVLCVYDI